MHNFPFYDIILPRKEGDFMNQLSVEDLEDESLIELLEILEGMEDVIKEEEVEVDE